MSVRVRVNMKPVNTILTRLGVDKTGDVQMQTTRIINQRITRYMPFRSGVLATKLKHIKSPTEIEVLGPYARYQYYGKVMVGRAPKTVTDMTIHGYDAILKAEEKFLTEEDTGEWPRLQSDVVSSICTRLGLINGSTINDPLNKVSYPGDYTMREVLSHIAAANGGNWMISGDNRLKLIPLRGSTTAFDLGNKALTLDSADALPAYTGVRVFYDDEHAFFAGTEDYVLETECPWATQTIANNILAAISGYQYQPFSASGAILPLEAELGDGVTVGGVTSLLCAINTVYDPMCASDISAPYEKEVDHEFPYQTKEQRKLKRKVSLGQSYYGTKISRQNGLEVVKTTADGTEKSRVMLNSDVLAFYNDDGAEALYFDAASGTYKFRGDVSITGGTMNINNKFIVDADGNVTLSGNINLSNGKITWGENDPGAEYLKSIQITEIDQDGVKAAKIEGAEIFGSSVYGGIFSDLTKTSFLKMETFNDDTKSSATLVHMYPAYSDTTPLMAMGYMEVLGETLWAFMVQGGFVLGRRNDGTIKAYGTWDFSGATVTGLP